MLNNTRDFERWNTLDSSTRDEAGRNARWILARTTRRAHLDLGERSSKSLRVQGEHVIVTACRAHVDANAEVVPETHHPRCSNCMRIWRDAKPESKRMGQTLNTGSWLSLAWLIAGGWHARVCLG
jgi:hypothetical protein